MLLMSTTNVCFCGERKFGAMNTARRNFLFFFMAQFGFVAWLSYDTGLFILGEDQVLR